MGAITTTVTAPLIYSSIQLDSEIALSRKIVQEHLETEGGEWGIKKLTEMYWRAGSGSLDCFLDIFHYQLLELSVAKTCWDASFGDVGFPIQADMVISLSCQRLSPPSLETNHFTLSGSITLSEG